MLSIDGDMGEGGGQILRTSLTLSLCFNRPFRIRHIRARRKKPGLQPQHLVAVTAAAAVGHAEVHGAALGATEIVFAPRQLTPGDYRFDIGTAGSTSLILQTLLPALLTAPTASRLTLLGGTHNPLAPPYEFLRFAYLPLLRRMGADVTAKLHEAGFYPVGGGSVGVEIQPVKQLQPLNLPERGELKSLTAHALLARLPEHIAIRELQVLQRQLQMNKSRLRMQHLHTAKCPGNALILVIESEHCNEVISAIGRRGVPAETVAQSVVDRAQRYLHANVPVGQHLADQLLIPLVLAGSGSYCTLEPDSHTRTNIDVIRAFRDADVRCDRRDPQRWTLSVSCRHR
jgi:RNA 3'-terminal phosphate cyclase (ATP)